MLIQILACAWLGGSLGVLADLHILNWQWWAIYAPTVVLFFLSEASE